MSGLRTVLAADSVDLFHRFKYVLVPGLAAWALLFVGTSLRCALWDCNDVQTDKSGTVVTSHDVGLKMTLSTREPMPVVLLATHSFAALGLVIATLAQKEGVAAAAQLERAAALYRIPGELGPQLPQALKDARALVALLRERGEEADAAALERSFSL